MPPTIPVLNASENFPLMELCNNIYGRNSATKRIRFRRYRISRAFANLRVLFIASVFCGRIPKQRFETYKIFNVSIEMFRFNKFIRVMRNRGLLPNGLNISSVLVLLFVENYQW